MGRVRGRKKDWKKRKEKNRIEIESIKNFVNNK